MKKIIFLLFICFVISDSALARAQWCHKHCGADGKSLGTKCPKGNNVAFNEIPKGKICKKDLTSSGFGNAKIGWAKNCAVPAGELSPSQWSCISTGNIIGQILDTFLTLGIAIDMRNNFCSFSPGNQRLEGAIIDRKILSKHCNKSPYNKTIEARHNCISCVLKGKLPNPPGLATKCNYPLPNSGSLPTDPLKLDNYTNTSLCSGIPNLERPAIDDDTNMQLYVDNNNKKVSADDPNGKAVYCPIMRCNIPTNNIKTKYYDDSIYRDIIMGILIPGIGAIISAITGDCCDINTLTNNHEVHVALWGIVKVKGDLNGDRMCAKMYFGLGGWRQLACKPSIPPEIEFPKSACFVQNSALTTGNFHSQWILPMTSKVIEVTTDVFNNMFFDSSSCQNGLTKFQDNMKDIVRILLMLYIIIFGFRLATSNERIGKRDFFMFILKFALVVYFSVGTLDITTPTSLSQSENGLILLRNIAIDGMTSFSNMVMKAGVASEKLCDFSNANYAKGYSYLRMWDTLDCKIAFYLGLARPTEVGFRIFESGLGVVQLATGLFSLLWALLTSFKILLLVFLFAFGIFLLSLVVYFTHLYIIAMVAVTIMIFFGPIFIPLALFDETKRYFDDWFRLLFGYALQPVIVIAVISFMVLTFDSIIYNDCKFTQQNFPVTGKPYWIFNTTDPTAQTETCKKSFGYILSNFAVGKYYQQTHAKNNGKTIVKYNTATAEENFVAILDALMLCTFFAFLFYYFASQIGSLAAQLSGAPDLSEQAVAPTAVVDAVANAATEGKFDQAKQAAKQSDSGISASGNDTKGRSGISASGSDTKGRSGISAHGTSKSTGASEGSKGISALNKK